MDEQPSKLWDLALVLSLIAFAAASYFKIPPFRRIVDAECPWVKEQLAKRGIEFADAPAQDPNASKLQSTGIPEIFYKR